MERLSGFINRLNEWVGMTVKYMIIAHIGIMVWGVVIRYFFKLPLLWTDEMCGFIFGTYVVLGGGYTLLHGEHVKVDILHRHISGRAVAILDSITFPLFLIFSGVLFWKGTKMAWISVLGLERSWSQWGPPVWPMKVILSMGVFLILIQGLVKFRKDLIAAGTEGGKKP